MEREPYQSFQCNQNITALQFYDVKKPITVTADASKDGDWLCIITRRQTNTFSSHAFTSSEANMAQIQKELLGIVFATKKFHHYIYGKSVTLETYHKPLVTIVKKLVSDAPNSLQEMLLKHQDYNLYLIHKNTAQMPRSDKLSRAFLTNTEIFVEDGYEVLCVTRMTEQIWKNMWSYRNGFNHASFDCKNQTQMARSKT